MRKALIGGEYMERPKFEVKPYDMALASSAVLNRSEIGDTIYIGMPKHSSQNLLLIDMYKIVEWEDEEKIDFLSKICRDGFRPWLIAESGLLDTTAGYHLYRFVFMNSCTNSPEYLYLSYTIQTDNPDRSSYIYMKR